MFVCYQTSIPNQFEFIQIRWVNRPNFISDRIPPYYRTRRFGGRRLRSYHRSEHLNGSRNREQQTSRSRTTQQERPKHPQEPQNFIVPTGGAYFFVPSIAALENELSA